MHEVEKGQGCRFIRLLLYIVMHTGIARHRGQHSTTSNFPLPRTSSDSYQHGNTTAIAFPFTNPSLRVLYSSVIDQLRYSIPSRFRTCSLTLLSNSGRLSRYSLQHYHQHLPCTASNPDIQYTRVKWTDVSEYWKRERRMTKRTRGRAEYSPQYQPHFQYWVLPAYLIHSIRQI